MVLLVFAYSPAARAGTFPVSQEVVVTGSSDGANRTLSDDGVMETLTEADVAPDPIVPPGTENITGGTLVSGNFSSDLLTSDDAYVRYREGAAPPVSVVTNGPAQNGTGCSWSSCPEGRVSDNVSASSSAALDMAPYRAFGFAVPTDAANLRVEVGTEAYEPSGNDRISASISWDGGSTFCPAISVNLPGADPNTYSFVNFTACPGHTWATADFTGDNIVTRFTHTQVGGTAETVYLDSNVVRVTYETNYWLSVRYNWSAIPAGNGYTLTIEGAISDENVSVEVLTPPSTWTNRLTFTTATDQTISYALTAAEVVARNLTIRFTDASGPDGIQSDFRVDFIAVTVVTLAYRLDVRQDIAGVSGPSPALVIKGYIGGGGENFNIYVWNVSAAAWSLRIPSAFAPSIAFSNVTLRPDDIDAGAVHIRFADVDPANIAAGTLHLDLVAVTTAVVQGPPDPLPIAAAIGAAAVGSVFLFLFIRRRRTRAGSEPRPAEPAGPAPPPKRAPKKLLAPAGTRAVAALLESGHAYLVEEAKADQSLKVLEDLTRIGRSGLLMTRRTTSLASRFQFRHTTLTPLAAPGPEDDGKPSLQSVESTIDEFLRTNPVGVVLVDDIEFLMDGNRFGDVRRFLRRAVARVSAGRQVLLVAVSPGSVAPRELDALEREMDLVRLG